MRGPAQTSEPTIKFLYQLLDSIRAGSILIPRFQRDLVWGWDRQSELLRSVRDRIPMGAIMLWRTSRDQIKCRAELAGHALPQPPPGVPQVIPLQLLLHSILLLRFQRGLKGSRVDVWTQRADELSISFREYKVPVISIVSDYKIAARALTMTNSQELRPNEADLIHASTWTPEFDLRDRFEALRSELLQPKGWETSISEIS